MIPRNKYLITPHGKEYNNTKNLDGHSFVVNTSIEDVKYVNRVGVVVSSHENSEIPNGSLVVVHHNVFRTYLDMKGRQRKSNEYFRDEKYLVGPERIYMYNDGEGWKCTKEYVFVSPYDYIQDDSIYQSNEKEEEHMGVIKHSSFFPKGTRVGFTKNSEYEFELGGEKMYRMKVNDICVKFT
tara:strand:- start:7322 stop:7867 length:546 start_codon:yes stop_codon:yes gene_type:complete